MPLMSGGLPGDEPIVRLAAAKSLLLLDVVVRDGAKLARPRPKWRRPADDGQKKRLLGSLFGVGRKKRAPRGPKVKSGKLGLGSGALKKRS